MHSGAHIPSVLAKYFERGDDGTVVWWMTDGAPVRGGSPFLSGEVVIGDDDSHRIVIADPFGGS